MGDTKSPKDLLRIVVDVPAGLRDPQQIIQALYRGEGTIVGKVEAVYDHKQWHPEKKDAYEEYLDDFTFQMLMKM